MEFPYQGRFEQFCKECMELAGLTPDDFSFFQPSTIRGLLSGAYHPQNKKAIRNLFVELKVNQLTGKSYRWYRDFAHERDIDPDINPEYGDDLPPIEFSDRTRIVSRLRHAEHELLRLREIVAHQEM